jgi:hypothetical protein
MTTLKNILLTSMPIPVLACSGTPELAVTSPVHGRRPSGQPGAVPNSSMLFGHHKGSYGYLYGSSAASKRTSPAPASGILVKYAG